MVDLRNFSNDSVEKEPIFGVYGWRWPRQDVYTWPIIAADWHNSHRPTLMSLFKDRDGNTAIMAGGNCGMYPLLLTEFFGLIYTFEPDPRNFYYLVENCQFNNIIKFNAALGEKAGFCSISYNVENCGMNKAVQSDNDHIPIMSIDSFEFKNLDFLMLDTEGGELPALKGSYETIKKFEPPMVLELGEKENYDSCTKFLKDLGYTKEPVKISRLDYLFVK